MEEFMKSDEAMLIVFIIYMLLIIVISVYRHWEEIKHYENNKVGIDYSDIEDEFNSTTTYI